MKNKKKLHILLCFLLMISLILLDQITKIFMVNNCEPYHIYKSFFGDLINIRLVYNTGAAFSLGSELSGIMRLIILFIFPAIGLILFMIYALFSVELKLAQRFYIFGILGGGVGNLIDRIYRPEGVVDFIDIKFFGIFGLERWPSFNIADSSVVIFGICLLLSILIDDFKAKKQAKN